jgi:hypothetical protein
VILCSDTREKPVLSQSNNASNTSLTVPQ